tara:strand:+ start:11759 stop:12769 length:1011 start_codon:yes stop_codon:yes gene_type:complete
MFMTHTNSVYSEDITLLSHIPRPQYVHQVSDGGRIVSSGLKVMPEELINYVLKGKHGATQGTVEHIRALTEQSSFKVGMILASGGNIWTGYLSSTARSENYPTHKVLPLGMTHIYAGYLANKLGTFDYISTDCTSCISGHSAWHNASNMIKLGILDAVVVVSSDNGISEEYLDIFGEHGLAKLIEEEDDPTIIKFRLGQGCNVSVFESPLAMRDSRHEPLAWIADMCIAAETHTNPLGMSCTGAGYSKVIDRVDTSSISFVKTHSTFSQDNQVEGELLYKKFGNIPTVNYKLRIGHTMGASTAVETALAIQEKTGTFLSLGAGMGNVFSSAVVEIV